MKLSYMTDSKNMMGIAGVALGSPDISSSYVIHVVDGGSSPGMSQNEGSSLIFTPHQHNLWFRHVDKQHLRPTLTPPFT